MQMNQYVSLEFPDYQAMRENFEEEGLETENLWEKNPQRWTLRWEYFQEALEDRFLDQWELPKLAQIQELGQAQKILLMRLWQVMMEDSPQAPTPEQIHEQLPTLQQWIQEVQKVDLTAPERTNLVA